jgi:hypothetical protein
VSTCRTLRRAACLAACITAAVVAAGCGGSEREAIPRPTAEALAAQSDEVAEALARGDRCGADRLADELLGDAESATLPVDYRAPLLSAARSLAARLDCPSPPQPAEEDEGGRGNGKGEDDGKGKGKGKRG